MEYVIRVEAPAHLAPVGAAGVAVYLCPREEGKPGASSDPRAAARLTKAYADARAETLRAAWGAHGFRYYVEPAP